MEKVTFYYKGCLIEVTALVGFAVFLKHISELKLMSTCQVFIMIREVRHCNLYRLKTTGAVCLTTLNVYELEGLVRQNSYTWGVFLYYFVYFLIYLWTQFDVHISGVYYDTWGETLIFIMF